MTNKTLKAVVSAVNFAGFEFPGLKLPDGTYGIGIPQVFEILNKNNYFNATKRNASQQLKRILGKTLNATKCSTELTKAKVNVINLETFGLIVMKLAFKGNKVAQAIAEASVTTTIEQAFDIAFDNKQALEKYQQKLKARTQGKITRRSLTDSIKGYIDKHSKSVSDNYKKWIYNNCSNAINRIVFGRSSKKLRKEWDVKEPRENMTFEELTIVESIERLAVKLIDLKEYEPLSAVKEAGNRLLIEKIKR